jgi:hypothetical protein
MQLSVGKRIGSYDVPGRIDAGGMGEVWHASRLAGGA